MHALARLRGQRVANAQAWSGDDVPVDAVATSDAVIRARVRARPHFHGASVALTTSRRDA
jgi:hypothetical protein